MRANSKIEHRAEMLRRAVTHNFRTLGCSLSSRFSLYVSLSEYEKRLWMSLPVTVHVKYNKRTCRFQWRVRNASRADKQLVRYEKEIKGIRLFCHCNIEHWYSRQEAYMRRNRCLSAPWTNILTIRSKDARVNFFAPDLLLNATV